MLQEHFRFPFINQDAFHLENSGLFKPRKLTRHQHQRPQFWTKMKLVLFAANIGLLVFALIHCEM